MTFGVAPIPVVVDASVAVELAGEGDELVRVTWRSWTSAGRLRAAPAAFWLEVGNALVRGQRFAPGAAQAALEDIEDMGLEIVDRGRGGVSAAIELAARHGLTVYDAAYLWLAIDLDAELATRDRALIRAAEAENVPLIAV